MLPRNVVESAVSVIRCQLVENVKAGKGELMKIMLYTVHLFYQLSGLFSRIVKCVQMMISGPLVGHKLFDLKLCGCVCFGVYAYK
jgi:hypothetical protein